LVAKRAFKEFHAQGHVLESRCDPFIFITIIFYTFVITIVLFLLLLLLLLFIIYPNHKKYKKEKNPKKKSKDQRIKKQIRLKRENFHSLINQLQIT
jgi:large-conductance mechanosensitive channel